MTREEFGQMIKDIRISMDMSQIKFAKELKWEHSQSVAQVESGKAPFPPDKVPLLCNLAPNIKMDDIIDALAAVEKVKIKEKVYSSIKLKK